MEPDQDDVKDFLYWKEGIVRVPRRLVIIMLHVVDKQFRQMEHVLDMSAEGRLISAAVLGSRHTSEIVGRMWCLICDVPADD